MRVLRGHCASAITKKNARCAVSVIQNRGHYVRANHHHLFMRAGLNELRTRLQGIQKRLPGAAQIGGEGAWGFDLSAACSAFLYALQTGAQLIQTGAHKKVMVIGADVMTSILDYTDRATCILFGDGAGAVILEDSQDDSGIIDFMHEVDGSGACSLYMPGGGSLHPATHDTVEKKMHFGIRMDRRCLNLRCAKWPRSARRCYSAMA